MKPQNFIHNIILSKIDYWLSGNKAIITITEKNGRITTMPKWLYKKIIKEIDGIYL